MKKIIFLLFLFSTACAGQIKQIVFLGDSLSDNGNLYKLLHFIPKSPPYYQGRFSNGPTWAEHVGQKYANQYGVDYKNFAYGGATALRHPIYKKHFNIPITLETEYNLYNLSALFEDKSKTLFTIWIGANDYLDAPDAEADKLASNVVTHISDTIEKLIDHGAQHFLILNLPDLAKTPLATRSQQTEKMALFSATHNLKLSAAIHQLQQKYPEVAFITVDTNAIFAAIMNDPITFSQQYGIDLKNTTHACWEDKIQNNALREQTSLQKDIVQLIQGSNDPVVKNMDPNVLNSFITNSPALKQAYHTAFLQDNGAMPCERADQYVFWDQLHPTDVIHKVISQIVVQDLAQRNHLTFG